MTEAEVNKLLNEMEKEFNGDPEHDAEIMNSWAERRRDDPEARPFIEEIGRRLTALVLEEDPEIPQQIFDNMVETADEDFEEACQLIEQKRYQEASLKLAVLTEVIKAYQLPEEAVWTDFTSFLESLIFQDYYSEQIGEREVLRHPMKPGPMLFTYGNLLIEMGKPDEALEPLELLALLNPVCMKYIFELGEAYKRTGQWEQAFNKALWGLFCASNRAELARCYRDMAYCLSEAESYQDAVMLYMLSLHYQPSRQAEMEIAWIRRKTGVSPDGFNMEAIIDRCGEVGIPVGISETVKRNIDFLETLNSIDPDDEQP